MQREHHPKNLKTVPTGNQNSLIKKASAQNGAKALKIMRFLGLVASQGGLFHLPENTFLKKVLQKCCKNGCSKSAKSRKAHKYWVFRHI